MRTIAHVGTTTDATRPRGVVGAAAAMLAISLLAGCGGTARVGGFENEADNLRRERMELQERITRLERDLELRISEIDKLRQQVNVQGAAAGGDIPHIVQLRFGRYTGGIDTTGDGKDDTLRVYLRTLDQKGRTIPVAGRAVARVVIIPDEGDPLLLATRTWEADQLDGAYREGMTGTHYTLDIDLPDEIPTTPVVMRVTLTDAASGAQLTHQESVTLRQ